MSTRELIQVVEIDQDFCSLTYASAPCTAVLGVTGTDRCFNTRATCQDRANYTEGGRTVRFCKQNENAPRDGDVHIPSVVSVSTSPCTLNLANASTDQGPLGRRATIKITFADHPYHDRGVDKYWRQRSYDPLQRSTFWRKWIVRNPYYKGFPLRVVESDISGNIATRTRNYIVDSVAWSSNGRVVVTAKDILSPLSEILTPTINDATLVSGIDEDDASFTVTDGDQYAALGVIRIDNEIMTFGRVGTTFTVLRAQFGTEPAEHDAGALVQQCRFLNDRVDVVLEDLFTIDGQIDPAFVNAGGSWTAEGDKWLNGYNVTGVISEPTKISTLVGELFEQCSCVAWWDEVNQVIPLKAVRPVDTTLESITELNGEQHIIINSVAEKPRPEQRVDQVWFYYGIKDYAADLDKPNNFSRVRVTVAAAAQQNYKTEDKPMVRAIYSRWLPQGALGAVITTSTRILQRLQDTPKDISFALDAKDRAVFTGDVVMLTVQSIIDQYGAPLPTMLQVTSTEDANDGHTIEYVATLFGLSQRSAFIVPNDYPVYSLATPEQKNAGCWICQNDGYMPNGDVGYLLS